MTAITYPHIDVDEQGIARFSGTRFRIDHVIIEHTEWSWSPEAIRRQHPDLTLAQIHSALAYYYDHQEQIDAQIEHSRDEYDRLWADDKDSPIRSKLRKIKKQRQS